MTAILSAPTLKHQLAPTSIRWSCCANCWCHLAIHLNHGYLGTLLAYLAHGQHQTTGKQTSPVQTKQVGEMATLNLFAGGIQLESRPDYWIPCSAFYSFSQSHQASARRAGYHGLIQNSCLHAGHSPLPFSFN
jgi:hypothetical protein